MIGEFMLNMQNNNMEDQDWNAKEDPIFDKFCNLTAGGLNKIINIDWKTKAANTDWGRKVANTDYQAFQAKRVANTDYKAMAAKVDWKARNTKIDFMAIAAKKDYKSIAKKMYKPVNQYNLEGNFIKEWDSAKEASIAMGKPGSDDIGAVCRGKQKTAYGFIWKFKSEQN